MSEGPTLRQLRYFLRAVETGSFSAAATAEHVAQPSLSEQIRRLERGVGAQLFTRTSRGLQLTDVGRLIVPLAEQTLRSADNLAATARKARTLSGGEVSFGTFTGVSSATVVEPLDVLEDRVGQFDVGPPTLPVEQLCLHSAPERLSDRIDRRRCPARAAGQRGWRVR
jgi:DNA-binding transcriptional LysR family regulator